MTSTGDKGEPANPSHSLRWLNRLILVTGLLLNLAWLLIGIGLLFLALGAGTGGGTPESGFIGIGIVFFKLPLWLLCYAPALIMLMVVAARTDNHWHRDCPALGSVMLLVLPITVVLLHFALTGRLR